MRGRGCRRWGGGRGRTGQDGKEGGEGGDGPLLHITLQVQGTEDHDPRGGRQRDCAGSLQCHSLSDARTSPASSDERSPPACLQMPLPSWRHAPNHPDCEQEGAIVCENGRCVVVRVDGSHIAPCVWVWFCKQQGGSQRPLWPAVQCRRRDSYVRDPMS